jgi:hypothetical protein
VVFGAGADLGDFDELVGVAGVGDRVAMSRSCSAPPGSVTFSAAPRRSGLLSGRMEPLALDSRTVAGSLAPGVKSPADSPEGRSAGNASSALSTPTTILAWNVRRAAGEPDFRSFSRWTPTMRSASSRKWSCSACSEPSW